jgi:hypothetical protein
MKIHWRASQKLLIFDTVLVPPIDYSVSKLQSLWQRMVTRLVRSLARRFARTIAPEQCILHLERCLTLDPSLPVQIRPWQSIWELIVRIDWIELFYNRLRIDCFSEGGCIHWYGYEPITGEMVFLESKEEAKRWLRSQKLDRH